METELYTMVATGFSYWFALLMALIVVFSFLWLRRDRRETHRRRKQVPGAGAIGCLQVLQGSETLPAGARIDLPAEGVLGSSGRCDVVLSLPDVAAEHLDFLYIEGKGLAVMPRRRCEVEIGDFPPEDRPRRMRYAHQGAVLCIGEALVRLHFFPGIEAEEADPREQMLPQRFRVYDNAPVNVPYAPLAMAATAAMPTVPWPDPAAPVVGQAYQTGTLTTVRFPEEAPRQPYQPEPVLRSRRRRRSSDDQN